MALLAPLILIIGLMEMNSFCVLRRFSWRSHVVAAFTLMEILAVLAIVLIISGAVIAGISLPDRHSTTETASSVVKIFAEAARITSLRGKETIVILKGSEKKVLFFTLSYAHYAELEKNGGDCQPDAAAEIPDGMDVSVEGHVDDEAVIYRFFPDGEASGPDITLSKGDESVTVGVSHLTGIPFLREVESE